MNKQTVTVAISWKC